MLAVNCGRRRGLTISILPRTTSSCLPSQRHVCSCIQGSSNHNAVAALSFERGSMYLCSQGPLLTFELNLQDEDVDRVLSIFEDVGKTTLPSPDVSARQWLLSHGASARMISIADACFATDFGCTIEELGMAEVIIENQQWNSGACSAMPLLRNKPNCQLREDFQRRAAQSCASW